MMQSTWHLLLALGHLALIMGVVLSESQARSWPAPPLTLTAGLLLAVAALYSSEIEVATDSGIETVSEPFIGIYAFGVAIVAFLLGVLMTVRWLNADSGRGVPTDVR